MSTKRKTFKSIKQNLGPCVQGFIDALKDIELTDTLGAEATEAQIKKWGQQQVHNMAREIHNATLGGEDINAAAFRVREEFKKSHYEWFKKHKSDTLRDYLSQNDLFGKAKQLKYNMRSLTSAIFSNQFHGVLENTKGAIPTIAKEFSDRIWGKFQEDFAAAATKLKMQYSELSEYLTQESKQAQVFDAYRAKSEANTPEANVARILRSFNDDILKLLRSHGVIIKDLEEFFFTSQRHNIEKMQNPGAELWGEMLGKPKEGMTEAERYQATKKIYAKSTEPLVDWDRSFLDDKKDTIDERYKILERTYDNIIADKAELGRPKYATVESFASYVKGLKRQMHFKDGESWAKYNQNMGIDDLAVHLKKVSNNAGSNAAVFSVFGPRPQRVFNALLQELRDKLPKTTKTNKELQDFQDWFKYYTENTSTVPDMTTSRILNFLKAIPNVLMLGTLGLKSLPDAWTMYSHMKSENFANAGQETLQALGQFFNKTARAQNEDLIKMFGMAHQSFASAMGEVSAATTVNFGPRGQWLAKTLHYLESKGKIGIWDEIMTLAVTASWSKRLRSLADTGYGELPVEVKNLFTQFNISPKEWEGVRNYKKAHQDMHGESYYAPWEIMKMPLEELGKIYNLPATSKITLQRARNNLVVKLNSAMKYQANYVVPRENAPMGLAYARHREAAYRSGSVFYIMWELAAQYKNWAFNFSSLALGRIKDGNGTLMTKIGRGAHLLVGLGAVTTFIDYMLGIAGNQVSKFYDPDKPVLSIGEELAKNTVRSAGAWGVGLQLIEGFYGGGSNLAAAGSLTRIARDIYHLGVPKRGDSYTDSVSNLLGSGAKITLPTYMAYNYFIAPLLNDNNAKKNLVNIYS